MHKIVEMKKDENDYDDNIENDFEENGVDVLSGSCRQRFAFISKFSIHSFHCIFLNI